MILELNKKLGIFYLTPFKFNLCGMIHSILKLNNETIIKVELIDILKNFLFDYSSELSYCYFIQKLKKICDERTSSSPSFSQFDFFCISIDENKNLTNSLENLYMFFHLNIKELKYKEDQNSFLDSGGIIDHFIRKCLIAFYKLSFEDLLKLYDSIISYYNHEEIKIELSNHDSEILFESHLKELKKIEKLSEETKEIIEKVKNYRQKYYFKSLISDESKMNQSLGATIDSKHLYFDYNMKYYYSDIPGENKTHYSLQNIAEVYYKKGYYEVAVDVLLESIKLVQIHGDHEGLIKCFLWLHKIFRNLGKFDLAKKYLLCSLKKSFENNYPFLFILSDLELSNMNFLFGTNYTFVKNKENQLNTNKIHISDSLSNTNHYLLNYKKILQLNTSKKLENHYFSDFQEYFGNYYICVINDLIREGNFSLALNYISIFVKSIEMKFNSEYLIYLIYLCFEIYEFDPVFVINLILEKILKFNLPQEQTNLVFKLIYFKYSIYNFDSFDFKKSFENIYEIPSNQQYYKNFLEMILFINEVESESSYSEVTLIQRIHHFKNYCKRQNFNRFKIKSYILISELLLKKNQFSEALIYSQKAEIKAKNLNLLSLQIEAILMTASIFHQLKMFDKSFNVLNRIQAEIEKNANFDTKFKFFLLKIELLILKFNKDFDFLDNQVIPLFYKGLSNASYSNNIKGVDKLLRLYEIYSIYSKKQGNDKNLENFQKIQELRNIYSEKKGSLTRFHFNFETNPTKMMLLIKLDHDFIRTFLLETQKIMKILD